MIHAEPEEIEIVRRVTAGCIKECREQANFRPLTLRRVLDYIDLLKMRIPPDDGYYGPQK